MPCHTETFGMIVVGTMDNTATLIWSVTGKEIVRHEMLYRGFNGFCSVLLFGDLL